MPLRLSELLERIRPAGTPGAPTEGEQQREEYDRAHEIGEIAVVLAAFEAEADALIRSATTDAAELGRDAERQARQIRAAVPERIATVQAAAAERHEKQDEADQTHVTDQTVAEVARLKGQAASLIPSLVAATTRVVWAIVPDGALPKVRR
jgi:hypothetical protein